MKILAALIIIFSFLALSHAKENPVYVIPLKGVIDLGLSSFIRRSLDEAKKNDAKAIILEIDTFGGRVDAVVEIVKSLEEIKPLKTVAFINNEAWSAGVLIALACSEIIMSSGSSIGSAEPRTMGLGQQEEATDEKTISALRTKFKAVAQENNHPQNLAVAMVDKDFEIKKIQINEQIKIVNEQELEELKSQYQENQIKVIKTVNPKGKLLNLTAQEAQELGLASEILNSRQDVINYLGLKDTPITETNVSWSENLVRFFTHPMVSPLLLSLGLLGLFLELKAPGWGLPGTLGVLALVLFFWGHYLAGLANITEILIFIAGIALLVIEVFVLPGFGIAGAAGIGLVFLGLFLALVKHPFNLPSFELQQAVTTLGLSVIILAVGLFLTFKFLPQSSFLKRVVLAQTEEKKQGFEISITENILGKKLKTASALRPAGKAELEGKTFDVVSEGGFIDKEKLVEVVKVEGNKIVVKEV